MTPFTARHIYCVKTQLSHTYWLIGLNHLWIPLPEYGGKLILLCFCPAEFCLEYLLWVRFWIVLSRAEKGWCVQHLYNMGLISMPILTYLTIPPPSAPIVSQLVLFKTPDTLQKFKITNKYKHLVFNTIFLMIYQCTPPWPPPPIDIYLNTSSHRTPYLSDSTNFNEFNKWPPLQNYHQLIQKI